MIKMLVIDLDNTLLRSDKTISGYTEKVLKRVRDAGIRTAFATARPTGRSGISWNRSVAAMQFIITAQES